MKNAIKWFVIVGLTAVFGFIFVACNNGILAPKGLTDDSNTDVLATINLPQRSYRSLADDLISWTNTYRLIIKKDNVEVHNQSYSAYQQSITIKLTPGLHFFDLKAFDVDNILLGGGFTSADLKTGMNRIGITLIPADTYVEIETGWGTSGSEEPLVFKNGQLEIAISRASIPTARSIIAEPTEPKVGDYYQIIQNRGNNNQVILSVGRITEVIRDGNNHYIISFAPSQTSPCSKTEFQGTLNPGGTVNTGGALSNEGGKLVITSGDFEGEYGEGDGNTAKTTVYTVGDYWDGSKYIACYWKDGIKTDLNAGLSGHSYARAITISDGLYIAGSYVADNKYIACYWKDGVRIDLYNGSDSTSATDITISEGSVYISGVFRVGGNGKSIACFWKDGVRTDLYNGVGDSGANAITVSGGSVYVSGYYNLFPSNNWYTGAQSIVCYWKDGIKTDVQTNYTTPTSYITVSGGSVYVASYYQDNNGDKGRACYWKDGVRTPLYNGLDNSSTRAITVSDGSVYISGYYNEDSKSKACYWKDGEKTDLHEGTEASATTAITVSGGSVYTTGYHNDSDYHTACYWKDGVRTDLYAAVNDLRPGTIAWRASAWGIAVVVE